MNNPSFEAERAGQICGSILLKCCLWGRVLGANFGMAEEAPYPSSSSSDPPPSSSSPSSSLSPSLSSSSSTYSSSRPSLPARPTSYFKDRAWVLVATCALAAAVALVGSSSSSSVVPRTSLLDTDSVADEILRHARARLTHVGTTKNVKVKAVKEQAKKNAVAVAHTSASSLEKQIAEHKIKTRDLVRAVRRDDNLDMSAD